MAVEKNPYDVLKSNVIPMDIGIEEESAASIEVDDDGGVIVDFGMEEEITEEDAIGLGEWYDDLCGEIDEDELSDIANQVYNNYQSDKDSRGEWEDMFERGFDLLGLKLQDATEPFEGACTAVHPLLIESAVKFQSKASQELFPAGGPVKTQIIGKQTPDKEMQANRVKDFMNYQLTEQMSEYFDEFERMLFHLPLIGSAFKKIYYDANLKRPVSEFVPIDQFYVSYFASDLRRADRYTHVIYRSPNDLKRDIAAGVYVDIELPQAGTPEQSAMEEKMNTILGFSPSSDNDPQYVLLEQHCYLDLPAPFNDPDGVALPYIVTIEEKSKQVLSIRRNYNQDDPNKQKKLHFTHYRFVPGFGFYGFGLMHFLGNLTMTATAAMRALVDAGQFANLPGGFKAKGVRVVGDNDPIAPGEFKEVESTGMDLSKAIVPLPYKEPSSTLYQMLQFVSAAGQKFADSSEQIISDNSSYGPVGTTMALLEASSKFFSAVHKRLHKSQKDEFRLLATIDYEYLPSKYPYEIPSANQHVFRRDFDGRVDVLPVSDPNIPSNAHRMMMAQMALQLAQNSPPGMFNLEALNRTILNSANMPNIEEILPPKQQPQKLDPVSDIMAATKGLPIAAFPGQDHDAHIQVKMAYLQDPMNGANPIMERIAPVIQANIQEHSVMKYQEQMSGMTQQLAQGAQDPAVIEQAMAQAAQQVMQANQMAAQGMGQSIEQQTIQLQQGQLMLEKEKLTADTMKDSAEMALKNRELNLKEDQLKVQAYKDGASAIMKAEEKEKDRVAKESMQAVELMSKMAEQEMIDDTKRDLKLADIKADMAKEEDRTARDMELSNIQTHRDERLEGEE
tara:strand:+ start:3578 stop:6112 length:2535 start_codon:yes stop_codon:yes gene_type:complete